MKSKFIFVLETTNQSVKMKKRIVNDDEDFEVDEDMIKEEVDSDFLDMDELENLISDEEVRQTKDRKINKAEEPGIKQNMVKKEMSPETNRGKQVSTAVVTSRLSKFGFTPSEKKANPVAKRKTMAVGKPSAINSNLPSFKDKDKEQKVNVMEKMNDQEIHDGLPLFLQKQNKRDASKKLMSDPEYDPTTLYVPPDELRNSTPAMLQYWTIKSENHDKVLFFKLGKFYEMFYEDAMVCQRVLDLNWMGGGKKYHVGFPEKALDKYVPILVNNGYRVAVVEQTETPKMMEKRQKLQGTKPKIN